MLNALDIKVALADFLLKTDLWSDEAILASEVPFCFGFRRADMLLLTKGQTHSFEVKSDVDTLAKLEEQISDYRNSFCCSWVVTTPKHFPKVVSSLSPSIGIIIVSDRYNCLIYRHAKANKRPSKYNVTTFLSSQEIVKTLRINGKLSSLKVVSLNLLRASAEKQLTIPQLQEAVYLSLYKKYRKAFSLFLYDVGNETTHQDISYLSGMK